ncbi:hypothetical protein ACFSTH_18675 [Paenibacillus yanchengensis]|uniref:Uncharacterized protein n=1 Tax=Paenibacillus yanchengensis TaxID=2035833 RepID=A0ABW4YLV2_9BACL
MTLRSPLMPLISKHELKLLPNTKYSLLMAAAVFAIIPTIILYILDILAQDYSIKVIVSSGVKV